jgi:hypothetical protein
LSGVPDGTRYVRRFIYVHKYDASILLDITLYARVVNGEFCILSVHSDLSSEVMRIGLFDPQAKDRMRERLEAHFLTRAQELLH